MPGFCGSCGDPLEDGPDEGAVLGLCSKCRDKAEEGGSGSENKLEFVLGGSSSITHQQTTYSTNLSYEPQDQNYRR